ncbi:Kelch-like protein 21 [Seminavis robusta]|uniref:Kelch-like protein 21 n=1 Tax=Seminavis robusta TaxID=568900 RepID=A0A9N8EKC7_9STRA|nr:Kelch-like protein 21 [Seminavis robusta]|eukprot:Sro1329_g263320.1 Kelch-like protein 21 (381) ;mRNA; f:15203-16345
MASNQLAEAILSNSLSQVTFHLDAGTSVDSKFDSKCLHILDQLTGAEDAEDDEDEDTEDVPGHVKVALYSTLGFAYPLHLAVVNLYHSVKERALYDSALRILDLLLTRGADTSKCSKWLILCNISGWNWSPFVSDAKSYTPLDLALFFKRHPICVYKAETHAVMEAAIKWIQKKAKKSPTAPIKTVPVVAEVAAAWKSLLCSEEFSDVSFQCSDGVSLPSHRNILAAASPYFATALNGQWSEVSSGTWKPSYPSTIIRPILELIYTGKVPQDFFNEDPLMLFNCASEYDIKPAIKLATNACIQKLGVSNVKPTLQAAHLHHSTKIKIACFRFVQSNATRVLTDARFMTLAQEYPELWSELTKAISSNDNENASRKRSRAE